MTLREAMNTRRLYLDGGLGTQLIENGLSAGVLPETWNGSHPDVLRRIHRSYIAAGADIVTANTFGVSRLKYEDVPGMVCAAVGLAREAAREVSRPVYVAYDVGPLGKLLKPLGDLAFEDAVTLFAEGMRAAAKAGADLILIETMNDAYETKAAVLAAKEQTTLPVWVTNAYDASGKLMTGATPEAMVALLEGLQVDALGINCSLGPVQMMPVVEKLLETASVPVIVSPNAGLPRVANGRTVYDVDADAFSEAMRELAKKGVGVLGGCCGTTPEYVRKTVEKTRDLPFIHPITKTATVVSSYTHAVTIGHAPVIIGERINPTGKSRFKQALREGDLDYILREGLAEEENGAHILDVNVGLPEIDEAAMMTRVISALQGVTALPLQIDTVDPVAMEQALRLYNGKPLINSVNGKESSLKAMLPLAAKYGGVLIALTLDDAGVPETAEGRLAVAERIVRRAAEYGIAKKDIIADPLAMTISASPDSARTTLRAVKLIKERLGIGVSLGVSNISFGLPQRSAINAAFYTMALQNGLDAAIFNPASVEMMKSYYSFRALTAQDAQCAEYIAFAARLNAEAAPLAKAPAVQAEGTGLIYAIEKGLCDAAAGAAAQLLSDHSPMTVINESIIPALDAVGHGFEEKTVFLPQLLMSAEAAKAAFAVIRSSMTAARADDRRKIVLATVHGDIHDIGKNIVKVLLENYGFRVIDLGKDVPPERVVRAVIENGVRLVGLSALMTTTVPAMKETIEQLRNTCPAVKVVVGGAVLTPEYAKQIGADGYARDAMQTVRYAETVFAED